MPPAWPYAQPPLPPGGRARPGPGAGKARQPIPGAGIDQPMLWVHEPGNGCVFVHALGHDLAAIANPAFIATFVRGAEWAATGAVTLNPQVE